MKVLIVHNAYRQPGGEESVVCSEKEVLLRKGHEVSEYLRHNDEIEVDGLRSQLSLGFRTVWSSSARNGLYRSLKQSRPDIVHFHNTFPLISPAAYYACRDLRIPVVQTLHNYRLFCPAGTFFRNGAVCEECTEKSPWRAVKHACYRESHSASAAVAAMLSFHHVYGTWAQLVDRYIALSMFSSKKFIAAGLPAHKILVKPNFVFPDPGVGVGSRTYATFVGRLSAEKGIVTLVEAWRRLPVERLLRVVGDGPLFQRMKATLRHENVSNVRLEGRLSHSESVKVLQGAKFLILPSSCYENFPMSIAESYACGTPVIASRLGAMQEIVHDGYTGLHVNPADSADLAEKVDWAWARPEQLLKMGLNARTEFDSRYTAEKHYLALMAIYELAMSTQNKVSNFSSQVLHVV